jgi:hypothetical protein
MYERLSMQLSPALEAPLLAAFTALSHHYICVPGPPQIVDQESD